MGEDDGNSHELWLVSGYTLQDRRMVCMTDVKDLIKEPRVIPSIWPEEIQGYSNGESWRRSRWRSYHSELTFGPVQWCLGDIQRRC